MRTPAIAIGVAVTAALLAPTSASGAEAVRGGLPSGGSYVLHVPEQWNGTALVWSPGYGGGSGAPSGGPSDEIVDWLVDSGYAVAGTASATGGWAVEALLADQPDVVEVIGRELGEPDEVIAWGASMGGQVSVALMESRPDVFDAALPLCGSIAGAIPMLNGSLDGTFALRTLLAPDDERLELVDVQDEMSRQQAFREILDAAQQTPEGRARIALAASLAQIPTWTQAGTDRPESRDWSARQRQLYEVFMWGVVSPRQPLEDRAGGVFSWNTGVDYAGALAGSPNARLVRALYAESGLDLREDLAAIDGAERISADPDAVAYMQRNATPTGDISGPVLTLHETGDTAPTVTQARTYADRVRGHGDGALLRQAFVDRPGHCDYSDAEIAAVVSALQVRLDTGRWANVATPRALDASADAIADATGFERGDGSFAHALPDRMLRPERGGDPMRAAARLGVAAVAATALAALLGIASPALAADDVTESGTLFEDAEYSLHLPAAWNGGLVVLPGRSDLEATSVDWLIEEGFGVVGYDLSDEWDLLQDRDNATEAWRAFAATGSEPATTVVAGRSQGGLTTRIIVEAQPAWLDGALPMCGGGAGNISTWNYKLDTAFALRELVDPESGMQIVGIDDRGAEIAAMAALVERAGASPEGRARASLAAALAKIPAVEPATGEPLSELDARIDRYLEHLPFAMGSHVRVGYEQTVGGVFSWNDGVDYAQRLHTSGRWGEVAKAYRAAGLDLRADLATLAGAERITADPEAVGFVERTSTFSGALDVPVLSLHTTGDGAGSTQDDDAYASTVRAAGAASMLRTLTVSADGHCRFTAAEEAVAFSALFERIETGRWAPVPPRQLAMRADELRVDSGLELGEDRFVQRAPEGLPARMWDARDWGTYVG